MYRYYLYLVFTIVAMSLAVLQASAEQVAADSIAPAPTPMYERVYQADWAIDTTQVGQLRLNLNSTLFFRDNEFDNPQLKGYTLPGFRLCPHLSYKPNRSVNIELGAYMLRFWGTDEYPNLAYSDIANWTGTDQSSRGLHALPYFRVQFATACGLNIVLGSIYGARYHNLIEPLYAPELNLTADPEAGLQLLYSNKWLDFDSWINWESFIYKGDTHQEAFTFGISSAIKYNRRESTVHLYSPVQVLFQHRGGEIDTLLTNSVQTLFNGSVGLGARIDIGRRYMRALSVEAHMLAYNQQVGDIWPLERGWAYYMCGTADVDKVRLRLGYFDSHRFVPLFGYPFYGGISLSHPGLTFDGNRLMYAGLNYNLHLGRGYTLGVNAEIYRHFAATGTKDQAPVAYGGTFSFGGAVYVRVDPSFLIKKF